MISTILKVESGTNNLLRAMSYINDRLSGLSDGDYVVTVQRRTRSMEQNKLYWMWLRCLSDHTGETPDALHNYCKQAFLMPNDSYVLGEFVHGDRTTTGMSTKDFSGYLEQVKQLGAELDVRLPEPDEEGYEQMIKQYG